MESCKNQKGEDWLPYCFKGSCCLHRKDRLDGLKDTKEPITKFQVRVYCSCQLRMNEKSKQKLWWEELRWNLGIFLIVILVNLIIKARNLTKVKWEITVCLKCLRSMDIVSVLEQKTIVQCYCHFSCNQQQHCGCHSNQYVLGAYFTSNPLIR